MAPIPETDLAFALWLRSPRAPPRRPRKASPDIQGYPDGLDGFGTLTATPRVGGLMHRPAGRVPGVLEVRVRHPTPGHIPCRGTNRLCPLTIITAGL